MTKHKAHTETQNKDSHNYSWATISLDLFLGKMIDKLERVPRATQQNNDQTQSPHRDTEQRQPQL